MKRTAVEKLIECFIALFFIRCKKALYMSDFDEIAKYIRDRVMPNDIVLTIGAGTVTTIGPKIVGK